MEIDENGQRGLSLKDQKVLELLEKINLQHLIGKIFTKGEQIALEDEEDWDDFRDNLKSMLRSSVTELKEELENEGQKIELGDVLVLKDKFFQYLLEDTTLDTEMIENLEDWDEFCKYLFQEITLITYKNTSSLRALETIALESIEESLCDEEIEIKINEFRNETKKNIARAKISLEEKQRLTKSLKSLTEEVFKEVWTQLANDEDFFAYLYEQLDTFIKKTHSSTQSILKRINDKAFLDEIIEKLSGRYGKALKIHAKSFFLKNKIKISEKIDSRQIWEKVLLYWLSHFSLEYQDRMKMEGHN